MRPSLMFYTVVSTSLLQLAMGILQLKLAALTFDQLFFDLFLSFLLLTGIFVLVEQSILTACINLFNKSKSAGLTKNNAWLLLKTVIVSYSIILLFLLTYSYFNLISTQILHIILMILFFISKSVVIVWSNIFAAQRKIVFEKVMKLSGSFVITLAFIICWMCDFDGQTSLTILFMSSSIGAILVLFFTLRFHKTSQTEQESILTEILSTFHYLIPGSLYVLILPASVSAYGSTSDKAILAVLRQVILAGSSLIVSPSSSYLILLVNTFTRVTERAFIVKRLNAFLLIIITLVFLGALLTFINFNWIFNILTGEQNLKSVPLLTAFVIFYYLELVQNIFANLSVNLREYKTGLQVSIVCCMSLVTFLFLNNDLAVAILLFAMYTLVIISTKILKLIRKHISIRYHILGLYIIGSVILFLVSFVNLNTIYLSTISTFIVLLGILLYSKLKDEFRIMEEMNQSISGIGPGQTC